MIYSCAYFTDWSNAIDQAQHDKLEMICRKLRLQPGERFLDIGSGWGGLLLHAARIMASAAHGITLSEAQLEVATQRIAEAGLGDRVTVEIRDYADLDGTYDKIASIGMYEHIGLANIPKYMKAVRRVLAPDGLFLNHAISHRASPDGPPLRHAARAEGDPQIHFPRRRARRHRPHRDGHGAGRLRGARRRGLAAALCADDAGSGASG